MKKIILLTLVFTLILTSCGAAKIEKTEEDTSAESEQLDSISKIEMPDTLGTGKSYIAQNMNNLTVTSNPRDGQSFDLENATDGTLTIYDNHTVSYTDDSGKTLGGFFLQNFEPYSSYGVDEKATAGSDCIVVIDMDLNSTIYFDGLRYLDGYGLDVSIDGATTIQFKESEMLGVDLGNLVMAGASAEDSDKVYLLFAQLDYLPEGAMGGDCYAYSISSGKYTRYYWVGESTDIKTDMKIYISTDSGGRDPVISGGFDVVYVSVDGTMNVPETNEEEALIETTSIMYYSFDNANCPYGLNENDSTENDKILREASTDIITIYSNKFATWKNKSTGDFYTGFYYQGYSENGYDYLQFTNGKQISIDRICKKWNSDKNDWDYFLAYNIDMTEDETTGNVCPDFVGTSQDIAPNQIFILYENESGFGYGMIYDYSEELFYDVSWQFPWDDDSKSSFNRTNPKNIVAYMSYKDTEIDVSSFDVIEEPEYE